MTESTKTNKVGAIYKKIPLVMSEVSSIGKGRKNTAQGYSFRGIDDVYNEIHDILTKHKVFTVPSVIETHHEERKSRSGGLLIYRIYTVKYTFYTDDGSHVDCIVVGEGMDSGDKAGNKALSVAHKYALLQVFAIPTEEAKDPEVDSPQLEGTPKPPTKKKVVQEDEGDISDLASNPVKDLAEKEKIAKKIKDDLEGRAIGPRSFKAFLAKNQSNLKPPRMFIGKKFGNLSMSEGKLEDLWYLEKALDTFVNMYISDQATQKKEGDDGQQDLLK